MFKYEKKIWGLKMYENWFEYKSNDNSIFSLNAYLHIRDNSHKKTFHLKRNSYSVENILNESDDQLLARFSKTNRYQIKKAIKEGINCSQENDLLKFENFFNQFAKEKHLPKVSARNLKSLEPNLTISFACLNNHTLVAHSYITDQDLGIVRLYHSASKRLDETYENLTIGMANKLLHYKDMIFFKENGFKIYDFGGYYESTNKSLQGINRFKLSFGGEKVTHSNYFSPTCLVFRKTSQIIEKVKKRIAYLPHVPF
ncbi:hypothetical protein [Solitalea koreensis]|uniref:Acetyltransferase (GNAT) domain-containing protein n=1 Tax=Solitalea koreensis TaxID=543615 RepID=A0A521BRQ5_9SPHI|nr:hypothetical protein [Solitalea koreensis]SMO49220.1 hypothetical protein SAMN06265350_102401 [Solitalea koreensis]